MIIIKDKEPIFETEKYDVILVGTSIYDTLYNGFQGKMVNKYPYISEENHKQTYADSRRLGTRLTIVKKNMPIISLLYICHYPLKNKTTLDYDALKRCLDTAALEFKCKRILTTVLGGTVFDGKGNKKRILNMMSKAFEKLDVDVYDYKQTYIKEEAKTKRKELTEIGVTDSQKRIEILKQLYLIPADGKK